MCEDLFLPLHYARYGAVNNTFTRIGWNKKKVDWDTDYENLISDSNSNLKKKCVLHFMTIFLPFTV